MDDLRDLVAQTRQEIDAHQTALDNLVAQIIEAGIATSEEIEAWRAHDKAEAERLKGVPIL